MELFVSTDLYRLCVLSCFCRILGERGVDQPRGGGRAERHALLPGRHAGAVHYRVYRAAVYRHSFDVDGTSWDRCFVLLCLDLQYTAIIPC